MFLMARAVDPTFPGLSTEWRTMVRFEKSGILFVLSVIILFPVEQNSSAFQPPEEEVDPTFRRADPLSETLFQEEGEGGEVPLPVDPFPEEAPNLVQPEGGRGGEAKETQDLFDPSETASGDEKDDTTLFGVPGDPPDRNSLLPGKTTSARHNR